jgi:hypothetical protein
MLNRKTVSVFFICLFICSLPARCHAYTTEHHLINMGRNLLNIVASPIKGVFINGPREVKKKFRYEVFEQENPENNKRLGSFLFALWSSPAVEVKSIVDGIVDSSCYAGKFIKEFLSIPFSD